jgi:hypothetical protein
MKLYEAKNIITEVFENPFDKDKFKYFIRNLLKNLHPAEFLRNGYNIPKERALRIDGTQENIGNESIHSLRFN